MVAFGEEQPPRRDCPGGDIGAASPQRCGLLLWPDR